MAFQRIPISSRQQWLAARRRDVTASDAAALFGRHEHKTPFEVFVNKKFVEADEDTGLFRRGRWFEYSALVASRELHPTWSIEQGESYWRDPESRLGATPDFEFYDPEGKRHGLIQAKTVAPKVFEQKWLDNNSPPGWITLQINTELGLSGLTHGIIGAIVMDINDPLYEEFPLEFNPEVFEATRKASREFWDLIDAGKNPEPDFARDHDAIAKLYGTETWDAIDLSNDERVEHLLANRESLDLSISSYKDQKKQIDAEIRHIIGTADEAMTKSFEITCRTVVRKGSFQPETRSRVLRINRKKESINAKE